MLFSGLLALNAFNLRLPEPRHHRADLRLHRPLAVVAFLLFVAVLVLLVRNVLKLYADQRSRVMGSRLRTRMLWGAVLVSLIPIVFMFVFSYGLMNRAVERWFSGPVTEMRDDSNSMALELSRYTTCQRPRRSRLHRHNSTPRRCCRRRSSPGSTDPLAVIASIQHAPPPGPAACLCSRSRTPRGSA